MMETTLLIIRECPCGRHLLTTDPRTGRYVTPPEDDACRFAERRRRLVMDTAITSSQRMAGRDFDPRLVVAGSRPPRRERSGRSKR